MKIEKALVEEYMSPDGIYAKPKLTLTIDGALPKGVKVEQADEDHVVRVTGWKYSFLADMLVLGTDPDRHLHLNTFFPGRNWFAVEVNQHPHAWQWYLPLDRARRELARHQQDWTLVPDAAYAEQSLVVWRLREKELTCKGKPSWSLVTDYPFCGNPAVHEIRRGDYYIPLCQDHLTQFTAEAARRRAK